MGEAPDVATATNQSAAGGGGGTGRIVMLAALAVALLIALGSAATYAFITPARAPAASGATSDTSRPLAITTEPPGARVEWQGKVLGETPLTTRLPVGTHSLKVTRDGYAHETLAVTISANDTERRSQLTLTKLEPAAPRPADSARVEVPTPAPVAAGVLGGRGGARAGAGGPLRGGGSTGAGKSGPAAAVNVPPPTAPSPPPAAAPTETPASAPSAKESVKVKVIGEKKTNVVVVE